LEKRRDIIPPALFERGRRKGGDGSKGNGPRKRSVPRRILGYISGKKGVAHPPWGGLTGDKKLPIRERNLDKG